MTTNPPETAANGNKNFFHIEWLDTSLRRWCCIHRRNTTGRRNTQQHETRRLTHGALLCYSACQSSAGLGFFATWIRTRLCYSAWALLFGYGSTLGDAALTLGLALGVKHWGHLHKVRYILREFPRIPNLYIEDKIALNYPHRMLGMYPAAKNTRGNCLQVIATPIQTLCYRCTWCRDRSWKLHHCSSSTIPWRHHR